MIWWYPDEKSAIIQKAEMQVKNFEDQYIFRSYYQWRTLQQGRRYLVTHQ
jgi:hypothetical protein